jgi:hypothetical protein
MKFLRPLRKPSPRCTNYIYICYTVISSPLKINCQDISKPVSIPVSVAYITLSSNFLYTLQYPAVHTCSTHSTQYPAVPTVPTVHNCHFSPCSTHSTHSTLQYPPTGTVQYPQYPQYPAVPICSTLHSTGTAAVPTGTVQYPPG